MVQDINMLKKIKSLIKKWWKKQEDDIEELMDLQFPEPEKINMNNLCPKCNKDFGCECND